MESRWRHEVKVKRPAVPHCKPTLTEKNVLCKLLAGNNCTFKHEYSNGDGGQGANGGEKRKSNDELLGQLTKKVQSFKATATKAASGCSRCMQHPLTSRSFKFGFANDLERIMWASTPTPPSQFPDTNVILGGFVTTQIGARRWNSRVSRETTVR